MKRLFSLLFIVVAINSNAFAQKLDRTKFFEDESIINATLEMDLKDLLGKKAKERFLPGTFTMSFKDGTTITEKMAASARGNFRRETCYMPGLKVDFRKDSNSRFSKLKELKMTNGCNSGDAPGQLALKEYLVYKMYNIITDMSQRVRLMKVEFKDQAGKKKSYSQYAFFIEDIDDMAKRNKMIEVEGTTFYTEQTDRNQMTLVTLFQYMVGNTDWSVPAYHNVKLIGPKDDKTVRPFVIAYDFDICGFVNPPYATIDEQLQDKISSVTERLNRGFPRSMEELKVAVKLFNDKKDQVLGVINNCEYLGTREKKVALDYIDDFYRIINSDRELQKTFVDGGRTN